MARHASIRLDWRYSSPGCQRGLVSVFAVLLLLAGVSFFLLQTLRQSAQGGIDSLRQLDSQAALLLAESGLERSRALLHAVDLSQAAGCQSLAAGSPYGLGDGNVVLAGTPSRQGQSCSSDCDTCTVSATGRVRGTVRELLLVLSQTGRSSAAGCGGSGVLPVSCPVAGIAAADWHAVVEHSVPLQPTPALLLTNLGFVRHPVSGGNVLPAASCAATASGGSAQSCQPQWLTESDYGGSTAVVGSRGAVLALDSLDYQLRQQLSANSLFAASAATFGGQAGRPVLVGSYWSAGQTTSASAAGSGSTNDGAACLGSDPVSTSCPAPTAVDLAQPQGSQGSRSWCWAADTLVVGFSGSSASGSSGRLNGFQFGSDLLPATEIVPARVEFPLIAPAQTSGLYSTLLYLYNPDFLSGADVVSGAVLTGSMGAVLQANVDKQSNSIAVSQITGAALVAGDQLESRNFDTKNLDSGTTLVFCQGSLLNGGNLVPCGTGGVGAYGLSKPALNNGNHAIQVLSNTLWVTEASRPYLEAGDQLYGTGIAGGSVVAYCSGSRVVNGVAVPCGTGGTGVYLVSGSPQSFAMTAITANGRSVSTASGLPRPGTRLAFRAGTGIEPANLGARSFVASAPVASGGGAYKLFDLAQRPLVPVSSGQLCGGICALFDHQAGSSPFQLQTTGTTQWALGLSCLRGVDPALIAGVASTPVAPPVPIWHERLR